MSSSDVFDAFRLSIPATGTGMGSWSWKEHKMVEASRKNKIGLPNFSGRIGSMEAILHDVPPIGRDIQRAYFPRLFGSDLWSTFPAGQIVTLSDLDLGEWTYVTATNAGTVTASGSPDRVIGRVMETNTEITPEGSKTTAKIALK